MVNRVYEEFKFKKIQKEREKGVSRKYRIIEKNTYPCFRMSSVSMSRQMKIHYALKMLLSVILISSEVTMALLNYSYHLIITYSPNSQSMVSYPSSWHIIDDEYIFVEIIFL